MKINKLHEQIWEIEDFLSDEELTVLLSVAKDSPESFWYQDDSPEHWKGKVLMATAALVEDPKYGTFMEMLDTKVSNIFVDAQRVLPISSIMRYRPGEGKGIHRDNEGENDLNNVYGLVIYLNEDYEGGEIYYPTLEYSVKPKKNSVLIHYAGLEHGVNDVTSGIRYVLTSFVEGDEKTTIREK